MRRADVLYCEGPGDIVKVYRAWRDEADFDFETSVTFAGQAFDACRNAKLSLLAVSYCGRRDADTGSRIRAENLPRPDIPLPKVGYHLSTLFYALRLAWLGRRMKAQLLIVNSGVTEWLFLGVLRWSGAQVVPVLHNTLWPEGHPPQGRLAARWWQWTATVWRSAVSGSMAVSPAGQRQARALEGAVGKPSFMFQPTFLRENFPSPTATPESGPFVVMYAGRVEADKGVFDLLQIAGALRANSPGRYAIDVCGDGTALPALQSAVEAMGLADMVTLQGRLSRPALLARYAACHVVIVPTTSRFAEGYAAVVAEAILCARPVITSPVVPASELYPDSVLLARTDDVASYVEAVERLAGDLALQARMAAACRRDAALLAAPSLSFETALGRVFAALDITPRGG